MSICFWSSAMGGIIEFAILGLLALVLTLVLVMMWEMRNMGKMIMDKMDEVIKSIKDEKPTSSGEKSYDDNGSNASTMTSGEVRWSEISPSELNPQPFWLIFSTPGWVNQVNHQIPMREGRGMKNMRSKPVQGDDFLSRILDKKKDFSTGAWLIMSQPNGLLILGDHPFLNYKKMFGQRGGWLIPRGLLILTWHYIYIYIYIMSTYIYIQCTCRICLS